jgi:hypothetical protein
LTAPGAFPTVRLDIFYCPAIVSRASLNIGSLYSH